MITGKSAIYYLMIFHSRICAYDTYSRRKRIIPIVIWEYMCYNHTNCTYSKGDGIMKKDIYSELAALNNGADMAHTDNIWHSLRDEYTAFIDRMKEIVSTGDIRGTVLVADDDGIIWVSGTRSVNIEGDIVSPLDTFEIGSVTKTFTASVIFRLVEEGRLSLTDRVRDFFPDYDKAGDMTVYDLLHMRSGICDFANEFETFFDMRNKNASFEKAFWADETDDSVFLEHLYRLELKFPPASATEYSNTNYVLLAMIIENITGRSYKQCVEDMIFTPLGMTASSSVSTGDVTSVPEEADGYHMAQHTVRGAGDIHSNVFDMLRFDRAYFAGKVVSDASMHTMLTFDSGYGCGWTTDGFCWWNEDGHDADMVFHGGETLSYDCDNIVYRVKGHRVYLIMMNPCFTDKTRSIAELCSEYFC